MGKALTDIGNGGLESTPIARRTNPEHLSASAAAVAGKPDCLRTSVKPGRNKTMAPQPPVALRANCHLGPLAKPAQLKQTLDGKVQEQYQGSVLGEFYSPCLGGKGWSSTLYPNFLIIGISSSLGRYNLPNSGFQSRHREQNHRHSVSTSCQTTRRIFDKVHDRHKAERFFSAWILKTSWTGNKYLAKDTIHK